MHMLAHTFFTTVTSNIWVSDHNPLNPKISKVSGHVYCEILDLYPPQNRCFPFLCYHCNDEPSWDLPTSQWDVAPGYIPFTVCTIKAGQSSSLRVTPVAFTFLLPKASYSHSIYFFLAFSIALWWEIVIFEYIVWFMFHSLVLIGISNEWLQVTSLSNVKNSLQFSSTNFDPKYSFWAFAT